MYQKRNEITDGQQGRNPIRNQLRELKNERSIYQKEKKDVMILADKVEMQIQDLEKEKKREGKMRKRE